MKKLSALFDVDDAKTLMRLILGAFVVLAGAAVFGTAIRVLIATSGLGG